MRLGVRDHRVLAAFVEERPADGFKLSTDGVRLDGNWLGGSGIAEWVEGDRGRQIVLHDTGSRAGESVHRALRHHAAPYQLADHDPSRRAARARRRP